MDKLDKHEQLCEYLNDLYAKKNHDYGDSVHDTYVKYGLTSFLVRMEDKLNRARTLSQNEALVNDEKLTDTLLDLANYAIISVIELNAENNRCMILANNDKFKEQVIDSMTKWISERCLYIDEWGNSCEIIQDSCNKRDNCEECIKEYFKKLAKGEN